jgi:hypothetical protein
MPTKSRPLADARNDSALEYLSMRSLSFKVIFASLLTPTPDSIHAGVHSEGDQDQSRRALRRI